MSNAHVGICDLYSSSLCTHKDDVLLLLYKDVQMNGEKSIRCECNHICQKN